MARNYPTIATTHTITLQGKTVTDLFDLRVYFDVQGIIALYESNELSSFCHDVGAIVEYRAIERIKSLGPLTYVEIISKLCRVFSIERTPMENQSQLTVEQLEHDVRVIAARNRQSHVFHQKQANIHATELTLNAQLDLCTTKDEHESIAPIIAKALDTTSQETNINVPGIAPSQLLPLEPVFTPQYAIASSPNKRMNFEQKSSFTIQRQRMTPIYPNQQIKALSNDENPYTSSKQQSRKTAQSEAVTYGLNLAHNREKKLSYSQKKVTTFTYRNKVKQGINHALTSNSTNNGATKRKTGAIQPISMYHGVNKSFYKTSTLGLKDLLFVQIFEYKGATTSYKYDLCAWLTKISTIATQNQSQVTNTTNVDGSLAELCPDELMLALDTPSLYFCANKSKLEEPHTNTNHEVAFLVKLKPSKYFDHYHLLFVGDHDYFCFTLNQDRNDLINTICSQDPSIYQICSLFNLSEYFDTFECFEDFDYESLQTYFRFKSFSSHQRSRYARTYKFDHIFTKDLPPSHYPRYAQFYIEEHTSSPGRRQGHGHSEGHSHSPAAAAATTTPTATATAATTATGTTNTTPSYGDSSSMDDRDCVSTGKRAINLNENRVLEHNSTTQIARSLKGNYSTSSTSPDLGATVDALSYVHETTNDSQDDFLSAYQSDKQGNFYLNTQTSTFSKSQEQDQSALKANLEPKLLQACSPAAKYLQSHAHHQDIAPNDAYCPNNSPESGMEDNFTPNTSDLDLEADHSSEPLKTDLAKTASTVSSNSELYNNDDGTEVSFTPNSQDLKLELEAAHSSEPLKKDLAKTSNSSPFANESQDELLSKSISDTCRVHVLPSKKGLNLLVDVAVPKHLSCPNNIFYYQPTGFEFSEDYQALYSPIYNENILYTENNNTHHKLERPSIEKKQLDACHFPKKTTKSKAKKLKDIDSSTLVNSINKVPAGAFGHTLFNSLIDKSDLTSQVKELLNPLKSTNDQPAKVNTESIETLPKHGMLFDFASFIDESSDLAFNEKSVEPTASTKATPKAKSKNKAKAKASKSDTCKQTSNGSKSPNSCNKKKPTKDNANKQEPALSTKVEALKVAANKETVPNSPIESAKDAGIPSTTANKVTSIKDKVAALEVATNKETVPNSTTERAKYADLPSASANMVPSSKDKVEALEVADNTVVLSGKSKENAHDTALTSTKADKVSSRKDKVEALEVIANKLIAPNITTESAKDAELPSTTGKDTTLTSTTANKVPSRKDKFEALEVATNKESVPNSTTESAQDTDLTSTTANKVPSSKDNVEALEVVANKETEPYSTIETAKDTALTSTTANKVTSRKDKNEALEVATNNETAPNSAIEIAQDADLPSTTANKVPYRKDKIVALEVATNEETVPNSTTDSAKNADLLSKTGNTTAPTVHTANKLPFGKDTVESLEVGTNTGSANSQEIVKDSINTPVQNNGAQFLDRKKVTSDYDRPQFNNTWKDIKGAKHIPSYLGFFNEEQIKQSNLNTTMDKMAQSYREAYEQFSSNNEGVSLNTKHSRTTVLHSHKMNRLGMKLFED